MTTVDAAAAITIPADLLPADGRFGCGPSKVRDEQVQALVAAQGTILGTSHRKPAVKNLVGDGTREADRAVRAARRLGDRARQRWLDRVLGRRHVRSGPRAQPAPRVRRVLVEVRRGVRRRAPPRRPDDHQDRAGHPRIAVAEDGDRHLRADPQRDVDRRFDEPRTPGRNVGDDALVVVDATSAAGGIVWDPAEVDTYYFAPQKCFASDGGLWLAACSPAAVERIGAIGSSDRWRPASLDLAIALDNSTQNQTYNTPALATLVMLDAQLDWMLGNGGLQWAAGRSATSAATLYGWAEDRELGDAVRRRSGRPLERRRHDRSRRPHRRQPGVRHPAGERHRSTPIRTASSDATSCGSACSRRSIRPTSRR